MLHYLGGQIIVHAKWMAPPHACCNSALPIWKASICDQTLTLQRPNPLKYA